MITFVAKRSSGSEQARHSCVADAIVSFGDRRMIKEVARVRGGPLPEDA